MSRRTLPLCSDCIYVKYAHSTITRMKCSFDVNSAYLATGDTYHLPSTSRCRSIFGHCKKRGKNFYNRIQEQKK